MSSLAYLQHQLDAVFAQSQGPISQGVQAVLDAVPDFFFLGARPTLRFEPGVWTLDAPLRITQAVTLDLSGAEIIVPNGMTAIAIENPQGQRSGSRSTVRDGTISPLDKSESHSGIGVDVQAGNVRLENLFIREMGTSVRLGGLVGQNVNSFRCFDVVSFGAFVDGFDVAGGDSNAGVFDGCIVIGAGKTQVGFRNRSFLGNRYAGCSVEGLTPGGRSYWLEEDNQPRNPYDVFDGCYVELDSKAINLAGNATVLGGNLVIQARAQRQTCDRVGLGKSQLRFDALTPDNKAINVNIPYAQDHAFVNMGHTDDSATALRLKRATTGPTYDLEVRIPATKRALTIDRKGSATPGKVGFPEGTT